MKTFVVTAAVILSIGGEAVAAPPGASGSIRGSIVFEGTAPVPATINPATDTEICSQQGLVEEALIVDPKNKGLRDVVVWIEKTKAPAPAAPPMIANWGCRYDPHVVVVPAGADVIIKNRDSFLHTSAAKDAKGRDAFNFALPSRDQEAKKQFKAPGVYQLRCDVHTWMRGFAYVTKGEIAGVTDANGAIELAGVPAGKHQIHLWHETLGERTAELEVKAGEAAKLELSWGLKR